MWVRFWATALLLAFASDVVAALAGAATVAPALSLPELLKEARRTNPDLLAARKRWEAMQARIPQATGLPAPRISVEFEEIPRGTIKVNRSTIMYQLLQSLPFPGKLSLRHQVAVKEAQVAAMEFKKREWDVTSQVKSVYYDLFLLDRELDIQREQVTLLQQASAATQARYSSGTGSQAELLQAQMEVLEASNERGVLEHRRLAMSAHLNHLLNRSVHEQVGQPVSIRLSPVPASPDQLMAQAVDQQPELLVFKFSAERADASWRLSKRELLPDLETMLELRDPPMAPIGPWDLALALVLPFWFWTKEKYGVRVALRDKESAQAAYQAMLNEVAKRIHENWHEASAAYETAKLCQDGLIPLSRQAVTSALAAYQGGKGSFAELLEALRRLNERERTYYQHLAALEQRIVMLEQSVGVPLRPDHAEPDEKEKP